MAKLSQRGCCRKNLFVIALISSSLQWSPVVCMKDVILSANTFYFRCSKTWKTWKTWKQQQRTFVFKVKVVLYHCVQQISKGTNSALKANSLCFYFVLHFLRFLHHLVSSLFVFEDKSVPPVNQSNCKKVFVAALYASLWPVPPLTTWQNTFFALVTKPGRKGALGADFRATALNLQQPLTISWEYTFLTSDLQFATKWPTSL